MFKKKEQSLVARDIFKSKKLPLLTLNPTWHKLFKRVDKTQEITQAEKKLNDLLKEQGGVHNRLKEAQKKKKMLMEKIMELTPEIHNKNSEAASGKMKSYQGQILSLNESIQKMEQRIEEIPQEIVESNWKLLDITARYLYVKMREYEKRLDAVKPAVDAMREELKQLVDEKTDLEDRVHITYNFLHDLAGREIIDLLDEEN